MWLAPWFEDLVRQYAPGRVSGESEGASVVGGSFGESLYQEVASVQGSVEQLLIMLRTVYDATEDTFSAFAFGGDESCLSAAVDGPGIQQLFTKLDMPHLWESLRAAFDSSQYLELDGFRPVFLQWLGIDLAETFDNDAFAESPMDDAEAAAAAASKVVERDETLDELRAAIEDQGGLQGVLRLSTWEQFLWRLKRYPDAATIAARLMSVMDLTNNKRVPVRMRWQHCAANVMTRARTDLPVKFVLLYCTCIQLLLPLIVVAHNGLRCQWFDCCCSSHAVRRWMAWIF